MPVLFFALLGAVVAGTASLKLGPLAARESNALFIKLASTQLTAEIQPRVFEEQFPKTILYVGDVRPAGDNVVLWRNVFMADLTPPEERSTGLRDKAQGAFVTVAREALAVADPANNRIQLSLKDASTHEMGKDAVAYDAYWPRGEQAIDAAPPKQAEIRPFLEMTTTELRRHAGQGMPNWIEARIEWNRRFALPLACIMLALVGIPLGASSRKGGKSAGYVWGVFLSFFCYYLSLISLIGLAKQRTVSPEIAVWAPNVAFFFAGLLLLAGMERAGGRRDFLGSAWARLAALAGSLKKRFGAAAARQRRRAHRLKPRLPLLPQIVDTYILSTFLYYFMLMLASFVLMTEIFNFFELLGDMVRNNIPLSKMFTYLAFLTPKLIYDTLPISVLVAVLVTFGMLTKQNEMTAFKACGVSLHRLAAAHPGSERPVQRRPVRVRPLLRAGGQPQAGRAAQRDQGPRAAELPAARPQVDFRQGLAHLLLPVFRYRRRSHGGGSVYELDPKTFDLVRQISAERARWQPSLRTWVFENGWYSDFKGTRRTDTQAFPVRTFPELNEDPRYFRKEVLQDKQMNFRQLDAYIRDLQQSGFDTVKLRVQFYRKFSVPLFALIMAMISIPFSFLVGNRGAMAGIGVSIVIAIAYWARGAALRADRQRQPVAACGGGMVARRGVLTGGAVPVAADAQLAPQLAYAGGSVSSPLITVTA